AAVSAIGAIGLENAPAAPAVLRPSFLEQPIAATIIITRTPSANGNLVLIHASSRATSVDRSAAAVTSYSAPRLETLGLEPQVTANPPRVEAPIDRAHARRRQAADARARSTRLVRASDSWDSPNCPRRAGG